MVLSARLLVGALAFQTICVVSSSSSDEDDLAPPGFLQGGSSTDPTPELSQAARELVSDSPFAIIPVFHFDGEDRVAGTVRADLGMTIAALQDRIITAKALPRHVPAPPLADCQTKAQSPRGALADWQFFRRSPGVSPLLPTDVVDDSILEDGVAIIATIRNNAFWEMKAAERRTRRRMGFLSCRCNTSVDFPFVDGEPLWSLKKRIVEFVNAQAAAENSERIIHPHELLLIYQNNPSELFLEDLIFTYGSEHGWGRDSDGLMLDARLYVVLTSEFERKWIPAGNGLYDEEETDECPWLCKACNGERSSDEEGDSSSEEWESGVDSAHRS